MSLKDLTKDITKVRAWPSLCLLALIPFVGIFLAMEATPRSWTAWGAALVILLGVAAVALMPKLPDDEA